MDDVDDLATWLDDSVWLQVLRPALREHPKRTDRVVNILDCLAEMLEQGERGRQAALNAVENAIRLCYQFTRARELAYEHYRLCLKSGFGGGEDDPEELLRKSIDRVIIKEQAWLEEQRGTAEQGEKPCEEANDDDGEDDDEGDDGDA